MFAAALASCLAACTPGLDWRELQPTDAPMVFMMPAKPSTLTRTIDLNGLPVRMQMTGARARDMTFTAAWADLRRDAAPAEAPAGASAAGPSAQAPGTAPPTGPQRETHALQAMEKGMLANIGATEARARGTTIMLVDGQGGATGQLPVRIVSANGQANGKPIAMQAMFAAFGERAHQFVVLGDTLDEAAVATFFDSVRLRTTRPVGHPQ